jgi:hypothetical protein
MKTFNLLEFIEPRYFVIAFIEGNGCYTNFLTLDQILEDTNDEYKYAIHERMGEIIALKEGQRLKMWFNRDNHIDSEGYIKRITPMMRGWKNK